MAMDAIATLDAALASTETGAHQKPSISNSPSVAPSVNNGTKQRVTMTLFCGDENFPDDCYIPSRLLEQLPRSTLDSIIASSHAIEGLDRKVYQFKDHTAVQTLNALKIYLKKGDYWPSGGIASIQAVDEAGGIFQWSIPRDATLPKAVSSTDTTHKFLLKEIGMYRFAVAHSYPDLRKFSANKICTLFPLFVRETIVLLDMVYRDAFRYKGDSPEDSQLYDTIMARVHSYRSEIVEMPEFVDLLRQATSRDPLSQLLLEYHLKATSDRIADSVLAGIPIKKESDGNEHKLRNMQGEVRRPLASPGEVRERRPSSTNGPPELCYQLPLLVQALETGSLLVAVQSGYGTLLRGKYQRNRDFQFAEKELLLLDETRSVMGGRNIIVQNSRGEKGDILGSLVVGVGAGLGVTPFDAPVTCRRPDLRPDFQADRETMHIDRERESRADREMRLNEHFSSANRAPLRARSRSRSPRRSPPRRDPPPPNMKPADREYIDRYVPGQSY